MIRKRLVLLAAGLLTISVMLTGCPLSLSPQFGWFWVLGADGDDAAYGLDRTRDGGFILAGFTEADPGEPDNAVLIKLNRIGQEQWRAEFGDDREDAANDVKQAPDGGFVLVGHFGALDSGAEVHSDGFAIKTDRNGVEEWRTLIDSGGWDNVLSVELTPDGGYLLAVQLDKFGESTPALIKLAADGDVDWQALGTPFTNAAQAIVLPNGNAVLAGWELEFDEEAEGFLGAANLLKVDADGQEVWSRTIPSDTTIEIRSIARARDGGLVLCGQEDFLAEDSKLVLWKTDAEGNLAWTQEYGRAGRESGKKVRLARDGGFIIAGKIRLPGELPHALLVKTDAGGNLEWEKAYGRGDLDVLYDVVPLLDGTFFAVGETDSFGDTGDQLNSEVFAIKTDVNGNVPFIGLPLD